MTTISITAKVDMQDQFDGFVFNKSLPAARVTLADQWCEHRFTRPDEEHRFTVTANLQDTDQHEVRLEFVDHAEVQGAIEILGVHLNGAPLGMGIYQCTYMSYRSSTLFKSHLYMGYPGTWILRLQRDDFKYAGYDFV